MSDPLIPRFGLGVRPIPPPISRGTSALADPVSELVALMNATPIFRGRTRIREDENGVVHVEDERGAHMMMSREAAAAFRFKVDALEV